MRFKIITAVFNATNFFDRYVLSIEKLSYPHYDVVIVDDASTDGTRQKVWEACDKNGWMGILQDQKRGALYNQVAGIRALNCQPDDILVFVDGDDQLAHADVLQRLVFWYESTNAKLCYGQYLPVPQSATCTLAAEFPPEIIERRTFREVAARRGGIYWNHLRTFKYELFAQLTDEDFKNDFGEWYKTATDAALMYPCLELAAPYITFIPEVLYYYTSDNEISDWRIQPKQCDRDHMHILSRKPKR